MRVGASVIEILSTKNYVDDADFEIEANKLRIFQRRSICVAPMLGVLLYALGETKAVVPTTTLTAQYENQTAVFTLYNVSVKDTNFIGVINEDWDFGLSFERVELKVDKAA